MRGCLGQSQALRGPLYERTMKPPWRNSGPDALGVSPASVGSDGIEVKATGARLISSMPASFLSVVVPAFNEERRIARTIAEIVAELDRLALDAELIVVDDGSTDRTAVIVGAAAAAGPGGVRVRPGTR